MYSRLNSPPNKELEVFKPIYGGKVLGNFRCVVFPPWIVTIVPGAVGVEKAKGSRKNIIIRRNNMNEFFQKIPIHYKVVDFVKADPRTMDLSEAEVIVAGGRGVNRKIGFQLLEELSNQIGGIVGCTRPIVDENILPAQRQIGQTGKMVAPNLFISCGISGVIQHEIGMKDSKHIVAINTDSQAQVFRISDLKIVTDVNEFLPVLIKTIEEYKKQKSS